MVTPPDSRLTEFQRITAAVLGAILKRRGMTGADMARITEAKGGATKKTIYNALNKEKPPTLQKLAEYAEVLGVPAWALLLDGLQDHPELLDAGALKPLVTVVDNYLRCEPAQRARIERMAQAMRDEADLAK